jgi:hypothetical protein
LQRILSHGEHIAIFISVHIFEKQLNVATKNSINRSMYAEKRRYLSVQIHGRSCGILSHPMAIIQVVTDLLQNTFIQ